MHDTNGGKQSSDVYSTVLLSWRFLNCYPSITLNYSAFVSTSSSYCDSDPVRTHTHTHTHTHTKKPCLFRELLCLVIAVGRALLAQCAGLTFCVINLHTEAIEGSGGILLPGIFLKSKKLWGRFWGYSLVIITLKILFSSLQPRRAQTQVMHLFVQSRRSCSARTKIPSLYGFLSKRLACGMAVASGRAGRVLAQPLFRGTCGLWIRVKSYVLI